ncbi:hypothetical protein [Streptomyces sp. NPDC002078]
MSYDIFVHRFSDGEMAPLNKSTVYQVLGPYIHSQNPEGTFLQIRTEDGGRADVYLNTDTSVMINHFGGDTAMDLIAELLRRLGAVLLLPEGTVVLSRPEDRESLPQTLRDEWSITVASTGAEIARGIQES